MKRFALLLATTAFVTPAMAADVVYEEPPAPAAVYAAPTPTWTGFYVGLQAGVAFDRKKDGFSNGNQPGFNGGNGDNNAGFIGGGHVGYDYQINNFIIGAVADLNYIDAKTNNSYTLLTGTGTQTFGSDQDINFVGTVRAKAGFALDKVAIYGTGGLAYANIDNNYNGGNRYQNTIGQTFDVSASTSNDDVGYAVGGGIDFLATQNISLGLEYLYTDLGKSNVKVNYANVDGTSAGNFTTQSNNDLTFHSVMAKASYRFN